MSIGGVCLLIDVHRALVLSKEIVIEVAMAGIYLLPGSKADDTNITESPPVSLHDFCQIYARQDDPITQMGDDYYISIERFITAPQTRRVAFSENNWDLGKINADVLVSFVPGFLVHTSPPPTGISVQIYLCVKTIRVKANRVSSFNVRAFLHNVEKPFTNSVMSTHQAIEVVDKSRSFQNCPWIKDCFCLEKDVCHLVLKSLKDYGLVYEKTDAKLYVSHFPWTTPLSCVHPTMISKPSHVYVHALSDLWMFPKTGECCNCQRLDVDVRASYTYPHVKSEPLLCTSCQQLHKKFKRDMDNAMKYD